MLQLDLNTERIIVPFSLKGVNNMAYLAHAETAAVWCVRVTTKQLYHLISLHAVQRQVDNSSSTKTAKE